MTTAVGHDVLQPPVLRLAAAAFGSPDSKPPNVLCDEEKQARVLVCQNSSRSTPDFGSMRMATICSFAESRRAHDYGTDPGRVTTS